MVEFLHGEALSRRIREVVEGENLFCAVAFWGNGAVQELFGEPPLIRQDVKIVCDLSMGATSPETLKQLGAPNNANLRHYPGLHAKVYRSDVGMIVGSANASNNGIGFMDEGPGLLETGVFLKPERATWQQALCWFEDDFWDEAQQIDNAALQFCEARWRARQRAGKKAHPPEGRPPSFLQVLREEPWLFDDVGIVITDHSFTKAEQRENRVKATEHDDSFTDDMLKDRVQFADFGARKTADWPLRFVEIYIREKARSVIWYTRGDMIGDIHYAHKSPKTSRDFSDISPHMTQTLDQESLVQCWDNLIEIRDNEEARIWTAEKLSKRLFGRRDA